jgi:hypothetical protein
MEKKTNRKQGKQREGMAELYGVMGIDKDKKGENIYRKMKKQSETMEAETKHAYYTEITEMEKQRNNNGWTDE